MELRPRTRAAIAAAREAGVPVIIATGRMFRSARPYALAAGITEPVVCYQGAVVADPVGRRVPPPRADADGGGAGGDRGDGRPRAHGALLRRRRAVRRPRDAGVGRLCELPEPHRPRRRRPREVAEAAADEAGHRRRAGGDGRARGRDEGAVRRPALHREVSPPLPRVRRSLGDEGRGARVRSRAAGLRPRGDRCVRRRGERRRAARVGRLRHRRRQRTRARAGGRGLRVSLRGRGGRRAGDRGPARTCRLRDTPSADEQPCGWIGTELAQLSARHSDLSELASSRGVLDAARAT